MQDNQILYSIGIVGARGYAGAELITLIEKHPRMRVQYAASRSNAGCPIPGLKNANMVFVDASPSSIASWDVDAIVLAVPDGATGTYVRQTTDKVILDLSSDHRFDPAWVYGLSEHNENALQGAIKISNPGCYATAVQLAIKPIAALLDAVPHAFGVSGYSGAGTSPSPRNNPKVLAGGISPYKLIGHTHEREVSHHLGMDVRFSPHVAPYFRGITVTIQAHTTRPVSAEFITSCYQQFYNGSSLIKVLGELVPRVQEIAETSGAEIGGICVGDDGRSIAVVCTIDNLRKGAASQGVQNLNLALGMHSEFGLTELEAKP